MPLAPPTPPPTGPPWPKEIAIRRLQEALDKIPELEGLHHRDQRFEAWRENLSRILKANWPTERLPHFQSLAVNLTALGHRPESQVRQVDLDQYRRGLQSTKTQLELILRNERELAEAQGDATVNELFRPPGSQHDAYILIRQIISEAVREIRVADNFVDSTILTLLTNTSTGVVISVLTYNVPGDFKLECERYRQQNRHSLEIRLRSADFHDRFIIVDGEKAYHLGASIKDAGNTASMIHLIEDPDNVQALQGTFDASWAQARIV
jgi:hypothetical protein